MATDIATAKSLTNLQPKTDMKFHEYSNIYRMLPDKELQALAEDIKSKGQLLPITSYENQILDGRNRYRACEIAGVNPKIEVYTGDDPLGWIASLNDHRRHDTANERAMVGARMANLKAGNNQHTGEVMPMGATSKPAITIERAAELSGSSKRNIQRAKPIVDNGIPELQDMVDAGEVSIRAASEVAKLSEAEQSKAVSGGVAGVKKAAKKKSINSPLDTSESPDTQSTDLESDTPERSSKPRQPLKIAHAMGIFLVAKNHMDKIAKNDIERGEALSSMIDYCEKRIKTKR